MTGDSHGRYRIISQLGEGGMGVTYRAWDRERRLPVVIKRPKSNHLAEDSLRRFAREIEAMVALRHDHIVPVLDHGADNGVPFVVMRFLPGGSLADQRRTNPDRTVMPTPPGVLHHWLPTIADAIDFVHRHGMVHRDVKPRNIFFDGFWNAFLGDFGIAKVLDESGGLSREETLTATSFALGTEEYMAPELFLKMKGQEPSRQSDQYALAVTVYEMLAGVRPFTGSQAHIALEHLQMKPPSLRDRGLGLPSSLCDAIERALAKRPDDRFPTCAAFAAAAIAEVPSLPAEPDIARLLCPRCNAILRIPVKSGGRSGACPTCKSMMRIAADLGALWLSTEDLDGSGPVAAEPETTLTFEEDIAEAESPPRPSPLARFRPRMGEFLRDGILGWLGDSGVVVPLIVAAATLGVTHELWSVSHQSAVETLERERATEAKTLRQRITQLEADASALRTANELLLEERAELGSIVSAASLAGITSLSPDIAGNLVRWKRGPLVLDDLTSLSDEAAMVLSRHEGSLSLNGLTRLSDKAAAALARHRGPVLLMGLLTVSDSAREALGNNKDIRLPR